MMNINERIKRLNDNGYKCIHIFRNLYLVRKHGKSKKISFYKIKKF